MKTVVIIALILLAGLAAAFFLVPAFQSLPQGLEPKFVGRNACIGCHAEQASKFQGSQHDCAMQIANKATVLGDFNNIVLSESGQTARFYRENDAYYVETQGEDGEVKAFRIGWTFGIEPLQQYMVAMEPISGLVDDQDTLGRVQVLRWCWDTVNKRWFHLDPSDVAEDLDATDELHWTGASQRWNNMCASCHSTHLQKNFSLVNATYHTSFSEIDVSCEACHGPGSIHVELAEKIIYRRDPNYGHGLADLKRNSESQIQACAPCHSRRTEIAEHFVAGKAYDDFFRESLLDKGIYFADGQVLEEDYVHGSFIQSKMYHQGIRCSDCHDPHTATLKHTGNQVCTSCHQHPAFKYDSPSHHFHATGTPGSFCVDCHMPATTYMEVDARRDHSLRIPRPDLSVRLGTPNACTGCHLNKSNIPSEKQVSLTQYLDWMVAAGKGDADIRSELDRANRWCDDACNRWYGTKRKQPYHFSEAIAAARNKTENASDLLKELLGKRGAEAPAIARATALRELLEIAPTQAFSQATLRKEDPSPQVRAAVAAAAIAGPNEGTRQNLLNSLLRDDSRLVRLEAAQAAFGLNDPRQFFRSPSARDVLEELRDSYAIANDRSSGNLSLGLIAESLNETKQAIAHYEDAIRIEPSMVGPRSNLAELYNRLANQTTDQELARRFLEKVESLRKEELPLLERDYEYAPQLAPLTYRLGLAYYLQGSYEKAVEKLVRAVQIEPNSVTYSIALILLYQKMERMDDAVTELKRIQLIAPNDAQLMSISESLLRD